MNKKTIATVVALMALPLVSMAAFNAGPVPNAVPGLTINTLIDTVFSILWPVAVAFFIIMFMVAAFLFFSARGSAEKVEEARQFVIWGVVGVVVALLAFSIPFIVRNTLGNGI
jgi:hypothetical protein